MGWEGVWGWEGVRGWDGVWGYPGRVCGGDKVMKRCVRCMGVAQGREVTGCRVQYHCYSIRAPAWYVLHENSYYLHWISGSNY